MDAKDVTEASKDTEQERCDDKSNQSEKVTECWPSDTEDVRFWLRSYEQIPTNGMRARQQKKTRETDL